MPTFMSHTLRLTCGTQTFWKSDTHPLNDPTAANHLEKITKIYQKDYVFVVLFLINLTPQAITNPTKITREKTDG